MNDLSIVHILQDRVDELGRGVHVARTDNIASGTFVCHLHYDVVAALRFGFFYKNGSTGRIVYVNQKGQVRLGTVTKGEFIISFEEVTTKERIRRNAFSGTADDIQQDWFNPEAQQLVEAELRALEAENVEIKNLIAKLQGLTMEEVLKVVGFVDKMND
jgi:hypothetical protein